jgi:orotidine-5'-phosphate decarboxylase
MPNATPDLLPADRLIVACPSWWRTLSTSYLSSLRRTGVKTFKVNGSHLLRLKAYLNLIAFARDTDSRLFVDLKVWDVPSEVANVVAAAAEEPLISFLTVNAFTLTQAVARAAGSHLRLLGVNRLTSNGPALPSYFPWINTINGLVCHPAAAVDYRLLYPTALIVTPAIRPTTHTGPYGTVENDDQRLSATPTEALLNGADYLVVGRPLTTAHAPELAARALIAEIEAAMTLNQET